MAKKSGGGKNHRDAGSGRYVKASKAKQSPNTTLSENRKGSSTGRSRSADTGQFVKDSYARRNPNTTVTER